MFRPTVRKALAALTAAVLLIPAVATADAARPAGKGKGAERSAQAKGKKKGKAHRKGKGQIKRNAKAKAKAKGAQKPKNAVFQGFVGSVDVEAGTVEIEVDAGNRWARPFVGETVIFDVSAAQIEIAEDINGDGALDLYDAEGEFALIQARIVRDSSVQPFSAHKLIAFAPEDDAAYGEDDFDPEYEEVDEGDAGHDDEVAFEDDADLEDDEE